MQQGVIHERHKRVDIPYYNNIIHALNDFIVIGSSRKCVIELFRWIASEVLQKLVYFDLGHFELLFVFENISKCLYVSWFWIEYIYVHVYYAATKKSNEYLIPLVWKRSTPNFILYICCHCFLDHLFQEKQYCGCYRGDFENVLYKQTKKFTYALLIYVAAVIKSFIVLSVRLFDSTVF